MACALTTQGANAPPVDAVAGAAAAAMGPPAPLAAGAGIDSVGVGEAIAGAAAAATEAAAAAQPEQPLSRSSRSAEQLLSLAGRFLDGDRGKQAPGESTEGCGRRALSNVAACSDA